MLLRQFEMPWRTAYEAYAAAAWFACFCSLVLIWMTTGLPELPFYSLTFFSGIFVLLNLHSASRIWRLKWSLGGKGISFISDSQLNDKVKENTASLWCGRGFDWTPLHTQRVYEIKRADPEQFLSLIHI